MKQWPWAIRTQGLHLAMNHSTALTRFLALQSYDTTRYAEVCRQIGGRLGPSYVADR